MFDETKSALANAKAFLLAVEDHIRAKIQPSA